MKKLSLLLMMTLFCIGFASAQRTVTGTITDETGEPLIGATVLVKGVEGVGVATEFDGTYSIDVPEGATTLVYSYIGFNDKEMEIGTSNVIDVTMSEGLDLDEVVVTGLGIKKSKKALGYGVSTISASQLENSGESDVSRALRGKTTGVDITSTSGLAGSGTSIIIRGYSSITGSNQPLFVVDGVPFNTSTNSSGNFTSGSASASSRFLDLDPNNIAEISILKGLSATVLYGEQGKNGVVLVTTKTGDIDLDKEKGFEISFNQNVSQTQVANLPDYQNKYGNGFSGSFGWFFSNWGPAFDNLDPNFYGSSYRGVENGVVQLEHPYNTGRGFASQHPSQTFDTYGYQPYTSSEDFFEKGLSTNTNINISKSLGNGAQFKASYSYLDEEGYTPQLADGSSSNNLKKHNLALGGGAKLANGLKINAILNYAVSDRVTPPASPGGGSGTQSGGVASVFSDVLYTPRSIDIFGLPYQSEIDGSQTYYRQTSQITHPLWTLNNTRNNEAVARFWGSANMNYEINDNFSLNARFSADQYTQTNTSLINRGGEQVPDGLYSTLDIANKISDLLVTFNYDFNLTEDLNLSGFVGGNSRRETNAGNFTSSTQQFIFNLPGHNNFIENTAGSFQSEENLLGLLASATLGYKSFLYLQLQARNDWTSTLEKENRSIFYPSANVSFILTDAIESLQNSRAINYLKVRAGIGTSAGYPNPYRTRTVLGTNTRSFQPFGSSTPINTNNVSNNLGNRDLKPEQFTEIELGIESRWWNNRIGLELNLYDKRSKDLIVNLPLDPATGFTQTTINAAEVVNQGIEAAFSITPINKEVKWDLAINFTKNENDVTTIAPGIDQINVAGGGFTNLGNFAIPGEPYGVIQGSQFERVNGVPLVNGQGFYVASSDIGIIGDPNPDYTIAYLNTVSYKGLSLFVNWNYTAGGDVLSISTAQNLARGNTIDTDFDRFLPFVLPGSFSDGSPNNIQIFAGDAFFEGFFGPREGQVFDGTTVRLREVALSYKIPAKLLEKLPIGSASLSLVGENLWFNAINFPKGINYDPEVLSLGVGNGRGIDFVTGPTAKRIGVNLSLTF